jgi:hypothetical protein
MRERTSIRLEVGSAHGRSGNDQVGGPQTLSCVLRRVLHEMEHVGYELSTDASGVTQQDDAARGVRVGIDQLAKIGVFCDQDALFGESYADYDVVRCASMRLDDGGDVLAALAQAADNGEVAALVCQEAPVRRLRWARSLDQLFVGDDVCCVGDRGADVLGCVRKTDGSAQAIRLNVSGRFG